jgi:protein-disulfide isomerase
LRTSFKLASWLGLAPLALGACALSALPGCRDSSASSAEGAAKAAPSASAEPKDLVLPGVDTSAMTARERHEWSSLVSELLAPCPSVPVSLAVCVQEKRACGSCAKAAKWVAVAVRDGASADQVHRAYKERFDPSSARALPLDGSPAAGPEGAPVTIVEFADFECPHCRMAVPALQAVLDAHPGKVRLVYKFVSLPSHTHAEPAARAAFAAAQQGKFWEMEHVLFDRQDHLDDADLERYARALKLDIPKWKADMAAPATAARLGEDRKLEDELKLKGTPTIYVNGRELDVEAEESLAARGASDLGVPPVGRRSEATGPGVAAAAPSASAAAKPH